MGLFSSNKPPQPPTPDLTIHIYGTEEKCYKPNDYVSGHVILTPVESMRPQALEVSLFGQSLVWLRTSSNDGNHTTYYHYRDNAPLFEVTTDVLPNRGLDSNQYHDNSIGEHIEKMEKGPPDTDDFQPGQSYTFPFSFRFPEGTGNSRLSSYKQADDGRWTVDPHKLPPTFYHGSQYSRDHGEPDFAKIEYGIRARLLCPGIGIIVGKELKDLIVTVPVLFAPINPHATLSGPLSVLKFQKAFTLHSSSLSGQETPGFRQSLRDKFSSSTPTLDFETSLEMPDLLTCGLEFRFRAAFTVLSKSANVVKIPAIHFSILKLDLLDFTFVRAALDVEAGSGREGRHKKNRYETMPPPDAPYLKRQHVEFTEHKEHLNAIPPSVTLELDQVLNEDTKQMEQAAYCETWFTARVPGLTAPSFRSFAVNRSYRVKVKLGIEVGGKEYEHEVESFVREMGSAAL